VAVARPDLEVFADQADAVKRGEYAQTVTRAVQIADLEYDYVAGGILLR
jgi:hypothetical protein